MKIPHNHNSHFEKFCRENAPQLLNIDHEIPDEEFQEKLSETSRYFPAESKEWQQAWAAYTILTHANRRFGPELTLTGQASDRQVQAAVEQALKAESVQSVKAIAGQVEAQSKNVTSLGVKMGEHFQRHAEHFEATEKCAVEHTEILEKINENLLTEQIAIGCARETVVLTVKGSACEIVDRMDKAVADSTAMLEAKIESFRLSKWEKRGIVAWMLAVLLLLALLCVPKLKAQGTSQIDVITFQDSGGSAIKSYASPFKIKLGTGLTGSASGATLTITNSGGTVTSVASFSLTGLFTCTVANGTTTPSWTCVASNAGAHQVWGNNTGLSAVAAFVRLACADLSDSSTGCSAAAVSLPLVETSGGTNQITYTLGDLLYASAANTLAKLAGNITATRKFLRQTGTGSVSAMPAWDTVTALDVGLGSVENTALSSWGGSANITVLGTIATGTVPAARVSGLAAVATSGSASDLGSGKVSAALLPNSMLCTPVATQSATILTTHGVTQDLTGGSCTVAAGIVASGDLIRLDLQVLTSSSVSSKTIQLCFEPAATANLCTSGTTFNLRSSTTTNYRYRGSIYILANASGTGEISANYSFENASNLSPAAPTAFSTITWASGFVVKLQGNNSATDSDPMTVEMVSWEHLR